MLRRAFDNGLLPKEVLWRTKEAFSDGVSSQKRSWFEIIQDHVKHNIFRGNDNILASQQKYYTVNKPTTLEQLHYRMIFYSYFPNCNDDIIPHFWMPNFVDATDASARTLDVYNTHIKKEDNDELVFFYLNFKYFFSRDFFNVLFFFCLCFLVDLFDDSMNLLICLSIFFPFMSNDSFFEIVL